ncbi:PEGA domain-containing protein [Candidatus Neomarinimicrobiota bacterium]
MRCLIGLSLIGTLAAQVTQSLAILDLEGRGISAIEAASLTDRLRAALVRTRSVTIVERGQMEQILSEQDFQITGCTSDECAVDVGQLLGVTTMVAGSIGRVGATYSVDIRTIEVQTGRISHSLWRDYRGEIDGLLGIMPDIANELVAAIGTELVAEPAAPPPPALLTLTSSPAGALISLNGEEAGTTPLDSIEIEAGRWHTFSLTHDGYHPVDTTILAESEQSYDVFLTLVPLPSRLSIQSDPPGARILLDGAERGSTPLADIEVAGNQAHTASISLARYSQLDTTFFAAADQSHELSFTLMPLPSSLSLRSIPSGAAVTLNRQPRGRTPLDLSGLTPRSQYAVRLTLRGFLPVDTSFIAQPGVRHQLNLTMQPVATAATTVAPPEEPPSESTAPQPSVKPEKKRGGFWVVLAVAATGYYGYTQGWFDEQTPEEELRVGNPPPVPVQ